MITSIYSDAAQDLADQVAQVVDLYYGVKLPITEQIDERSEALFDALMIALDRVEALKKLLEQRIPDRK